MSANGLIWVVEHHLWCSSSGELAVLVAIANHVDKDLHGCFAKQSTLAALARCNKRTAGTHVRALADRKVIVPGDFGLVAHIRADARPDVWDLNANLPTNPTDGNSFPPRQANIAPRGKQDPTVRQAKNDLHDRQELPTEPGSYPVKEPPPSPAEVIDQPPTGDTGREEDSAAQQKDPTAAATAFLESLPEPWGVGRVTAKALAPLLAERAAERRWSLDVHLTAELTKNPGGINDHRRVLRSRIEDLKYRLRPPAQRTADATERACVDCGKPHPNITDTGICPPCLKGENSAARRPMPADFRQALRRARTAAPEGDPR